MAEFCANLQNFRFCTDTSTTLSVCVIDKPQHIAYTGCTHMKGGEFMYSPYLERHNHTFTVALTERQFQWLKAYCTEHKVAQAAAIRDTFFEVHPIQETNENEK